jgi:hypothetical protein
MESGTAEQQEAGYGRGVTGMAVHRTQQDGKAYCGAEVDTVGDRASGLDAVRNHGAHLCIVCDIAVSEG